MKQKMVEVSAGTHFKIKAQAYARGMTMREYIEWLADKDKKELKQVEKDCRV